MSTTHTAGVEFAHNTDLYPSDEYVASMPRLDAVLRHPELWEAFQRYDNIANKSRADFRRIGRLSIVLGSIGLFGVLLKLALEAFGVGSHSGVAGSDGVTIPSDMRPIQWLEFLLITAEGAALSSILLAIWPRTRRLRREWFTARFMSERIRQWHFQVLLDGALVRRAKRDPRAFEEERAKRWSRFMSSAPTAEGGANAFLEGQELGLYHAVTEGGDGATDADVCRAYVDLRFDKQQAYFQHKREEYKALENSTEAVATWTLGSALVLSAAQLVLFLVARCDVGELPHVAGTALSTTAGLLIVLSLVVHVYRSAHGIPQHRERYESCFLRLIALRAAFDSAPAMDARRALVAEVEATLVEEMRGFLRQMRETSFLL